MGRSNEGHTDVYYRRAKALGFRARSAFKLQQLDAQFALLSHARRVLDLCAAPGSWSQYVVQRLRQLHRLRDSRVVAVDLQPLLPLPHVVAVQADITQRAALRQIERAFGAADAAAAADHHGADGADGAADGAAAGAAAVHVRVDVVLCDGAPDVTGVHAIDEYVHSQLLHSALRVACHTLSPGGSFVAKVFRAQPHMTLLRSQLALLFDRVCVVKPRSSRDSSIEAFVVCQRYTPLRTPSARAFVKLGDLSAFDAPLSHRGRDGRVHHGDHQHAHVLEHCFD